MNKSRRQKKTKSCVKTAKNLKAPDFVKKGVIVTVTNTDALCVKGRCLLVLKVLEPFVVVEDYFIPLKSLSKKVLDCRSNTFMELDKEFIEITNPHMLTRGTVSKSD